MELVGRNVEIAQIGRFLGPDETAAGPRALILSGEPGSGKSALLNQACVGGESIELRIAGREALQNLAFAGAANALRGISKESGGLVSDLFTEPLATSSELMPIQVYESIRRRLAGRGVVLIADDLQWLDGMTLGLIHYLIDGARTYEEDLRLVAATRPTGVASAFLDEIGRAGVSTTVMEVGDLDETSGIRLIQSVAGDLGLSDASAIYERSRGVPYWMIALASDAKTGGSHSILEARLTHARRDTTSSLAILAVLGRPVEADDLAAILNWETTRADETLVDLEVRGLVRRVRGQVQVIHDLIRESVIADLSPSRLLDAHRRIAVWLEKKSGEHPDLLLEAIDHMLEADLSAGEAALRLARSDRRLLVGEGGLTILARAADAGDEGSHEELLISVAELATDSGIVETALERWAVVYHQASTPDIRAWAALRAAASAMDRDSAAAARRWIELARGEPHSTPASDAELLAVDAELSMFHEHDLDRGRRLAEEADSTATLELGGIAQSGDEHATRVRLHALQALHDSRMMSNDHARALDVANRMVKVSLRPIDRLGAMTNLGITLGHLGRFQEAESILGAVWTEANRTALVSIAARSAPWYAGVLIELGDLHRAQEIATEGRLLADRLGLIRYQRLNSRQEHYVELLTEDWQLGLAGWRMDKQNEDDPHFRLSLRDIIAVHLSRITSGNSDEAISEIEAAYGDAVEANCPRCLTEVLVYGMEIAARGRDVLEVDRWLGRYREAGVVSDPSSDAGLTFAEALLSGEPARLTEAIDQFAKAKLLLRSMWARLDLARQHERQPGREEAAGTYRSLAEDAALAGALTIQKVAEKGLRRLGARTWRRKRASDLSTLTDREREVALMVSAGASNPEIAAALFLSRKTIERHVSNVLAKTGVRNRIELARLWQVPGNGGPLR